MTDAKRLSDPEIFNLQTPSRHVAGIGHETQPHHHSYGGVGSRASPDFTWRSSNQSYLGTTAMRYGVPATVPACAGRQHRP